LTPPDYPETRLRSEMTYLSFVLRSAVSIAVIAAILSALALLLALAFLLMTLAA
jgi:hypothetical protein